MGSDAQAIAGPLEINLYNDWIGILREILRRGGYNVPPSERPLDVAIKFFNVRLRDIAAQPRRVQRAQDLVIAPQFQLAIDAIERKAAVGESLAPHLSKKLVDLN